MGYTIENYENMLEEVKNGVANTLKDARHLGAIEAILRIDGKLYEHLNGKEFIKKDIEYQMKKYGLFGPIVTKVRKQTYRELMIELFEELINEQKYGN